MSQIKKLGILPCLMTPFDANEDLSTERLRYEIDWIIEKLDGHTACLLFTGTVGEYMHLTEKERVEVFKTAVDQANGRYPVMLGVCDANQSTRDSIKFSKIAEDVGADMILLKTPAYLRSRPRMRVPQEEIYDYFEAVSSAVNIPIMVYHIANLRATVIADLAEKGYIQYIKECVSTPNRLEDLMSLTDKLGVCGCADRQTFIGLAFGHGSVQMYGMAVPEQVTALMDLIDTGDFRAAWKLWVKQQPLLETIEFHRNSGEHAPNLYYALACRGVPLGRARRPRNRLTESQKQAIKSILEEYEVETVSPVKEYW